MIKREKIQLFTGFFCFIVMLLDAHFTRALTDWGQGTYIWNTHLLLLLFLFGAATMSKRYMITTALIIGSIFDLYYIGVLGIYAVALPLVVWLMYVLSETLYQNLFTYFFGMIILVTGFELITMGIQLFFDLTVVNPIFFVTRLLGPTLFVNIMLFFLLYYPLKKLFANE